MRSYRIFTRVILFVILMSLVGAPVPASSQASNDKSVEKSAQYNVQAQADSTLVAPLQAYGALELNSGIRRTNGTEVRRLASASDQAPLTAIPNDQGDEYWAEGFGFPGMNADVDVLAFGPEGALYAGGQFTTAGGVVAHYIARWDGSQWHPLGSGVNSFVSALAVGPDGSLYTGGGFNTAGGTAASRIARWDGTAWHPLSSGMNGCTNHVDALAVGIDGALYAGGDFTTAGGVVANRIARWNGMAWHPLGSYGGNGIGGGYCSRLNSAVFGPDGSLYVGGDFTIAGGMAANYVSRWDGTEWHPLDSGMNGLVNSLAFGTDGSLYAGGQFTTAGGIAANNITRWDGTAWHPLGSGMNGTVYSLAVGLDGSLYVGGLFDTAGGVAANHIARWDGTAWYPLGSGMGGNYPLPYALTTGPDGSLYAGGNFTTAGGVVANYIARWDGTAWHPLGSGMNGTVYSLAVGLDGSLYAGGGFGTAGGIAAIRIAHWDGSAWYPLGSGLGHTVWTLAFGPDGSLYAGGRFTNAGGVLTRHIASWDGSMWHPLGSGVNDDAFALAFGPDGSLYAGGWFTTAGGKSSAHIALWTRAVVPPGPPVILVHGWMGDPRNAPAVWRSCETGLETFDQSNPRHEGWEDVAHALSRAGYSVYVANLDSSPLYTPSIETNAVCLKRQIDSVASHDNPAIVIAHSMGGLVSRAYIENEDLYREENVSHVITLGTPHGGVNWSALRPLVLGNPVYNWELCVVQPAVCQFSTDGAWVINARYHDRARDSEYTLIGGVSSSSLARIVSIYEGPNDTFVGRNSARGYYWPIGTAVDNDNGRVGRYQTVSDHGGYFSDAATIDCIRSRLGLGGSCNSLAVEADLSTMTEPPLTSQTSDLTGTVSSGQSVTRTIAVDTSAASMFMLAWTKGALSFTLTDPAGVDITPSYAAAHPAEVSYGSGGATTETPPWASYTFSNTIPGLWTLSIGALTVPSEGARFMASVYMETDLQLAARADQSLYEIGEAATFTASLSSTSGSIAQTVVEAIITRSGGVTDIVPLADQGNGNYQSTYSIPGVPGFQFASVVATGTYDGEPFSRQVDFAFGVASPYVSLNGQYGARTPDENGDGNFDALLIDVGITATELATITLSADMTSGFVTRTLTAITTTVISPGVQVIPLDFPGRSIHRLRGDGPYTLTNVVLEDLSVGGVLADTASNAFVTAPYDHRQFGLRGDVDDSCAVDIEDVISIASAWNTSDFDPVLDINRDGVMTIADVMLAAGNWGASCWE